MAGYPLVGTSATITSITSGSQANQLLMTALRGVEIAIEETNSTIDVTGLETTAKGREKVSGLPSYVLNFRGLYPRASPRMGNAGLVKYNSTAVEFCTAWNLSVAFGEIEFTPFATGGVTAMGYIPNGVYEWSGGYTAHAVSGSAIKAVDAVNASGTVGNFKICEDGTDPEFYGNILVTGVSQVIRKPDLQVCTYTFDGTGDLTETAGSTLPVLLKTGGGVVEPSVWETGTADGAPDVECQVTTASGRTIIGKVFLRDFNISVAPGQPIEVTGSLRFTGAVARA